MQCKKIERDYITHSVEFAQLQFTADELQTLQNAQKIICDCREKLERYIPVDTLTYDYDEFARCDHSLDSIIHKIKDDRMLFCIN